MEVVSNHNNVVSCKYFAFFASANDPARDYRVEGPIVFPAGSSAAENTTQCVVMDIINDEIVEDTEEFLIILTPQSVGCKIFGDLAIGSYLHLVIINNPTDGNFISK